MLLSLLLLIFNITKTNAETKKKIDLKKVSDKLGLKIEIAEKGKKLKGFFGGNSLILSKQSSTDKNLIYPKTIYRIYKNLVLSLSL